MTFEEHVIKTLGKAMFCNHFWLCWASWPCLPGLGAPDSVAQLYMKLPIHRHRAALLVILLPYSPSYMGHGGRRPTGEAPPPGIARGLGGGSPPAFSAKSVYISLSGLVLRRFLTKLQVQTELHQVNNIKGSYEQGCSYLIKTGHHEPN